MAGGFMKERKDKAAVSQTAKLDARREERELEESKAVVAQLRKELAAAKDRKDDAGGKGDKGDKQQIKTLEKEVKDEKKKIVRLEEEAVELKTAQEKLQIQLADAQTKLDLHSPEGLAAARAEHQVALQDLLSKLAEKKDELKVARDRVSALEKTMRHLDQEKRALEYEKGVLLEENEDLKGELEDVKESSRLDAVEAANQLRAARTQARENHQTAAAGPSGNELRTAIAEKTEAQEEADRAYAQLREAKKATDRAMAETRKAQEEARKAKEAAEASRDVGSPHEELREELALAKKQGSNLLANFKNTQALYQQSVADAKARNYQNESAIGALHTQLNAARHDHSNETSTLKATIKSLHEQRASTTQALTNKTTELAHVQESQDAALNALRSQVSKSDSKVAELQRALDMAHASNKNPDQHKVKITQLETANAELTSRIAALTTRDADLEETLSFKQNELLAVQDSQKTYIESLESERHTLQRNLVSARQEVAGKVAVRTEELAAPGWAEPPSVAQWKAKVSKLEEDLAASKAANARLAQDSKKLEQYKSKLSPLEATNKTLQTDNSTLARDLGLKTNELTLIQSSNSTRITTVESELSNSVAGLSALLSKNSLLEDKIAEQEAKIKDLLAHPASAVVKEVGKKNFEWETELRAAKEELREAKEQATRSEEVMKEEVERRGELEVAMAAIGQVLEKKVEERLQQLTATVEQLNQETAERETRLMAAEQAVAAGASQRRIEAAKPVLALSPPPTPIPQPPSIASTISTPTSASSALVQHSEFVFKQFIATIKDLNDSNTALRNSNTSLLMRLVGVIQA